MAYDAESDRVILFGGIIRDSGQTIADVIGDTWAFDFDTNTWQEMAPSPSPGPRASHAMAYDSRSDRIILFAGAYGAADTWAYDFNNNSWENRNPPTAPQQRAGHRMAYDVASDLVVIHGGHRARPPSLAQDYFDTWTYNYTANNWQNVTAGSGPISGDHSALAYDSESDRIIHFGGTRQFRDETWAYDADTNTWADRNPPLGPRGSGFLGMAYDSESDRIIHVGSIGNETWSYDYNTNAWTDEAPPEGPRKRSGHRLSYDAQSDRTVLFGGSSAGLTNETWAYDLGMNAWTPLTSPSAPQSLQASAPDTRVELSWQAPDSDGGSPVLAYRIYRGTPSDPPSLLTETIEESYTDSTVTLGVTYSYRVSAVTAAGESGRSNEDSATPLDRTAPMVTIGSPIDGTEVDSSPVHVTGTAIDNVAVATVEVSTDGVNWDSVSLTGSSWSASVNLDEGPNTIQARAIDTSGNIGNESVSVVLPSPPLPPVCDLPCLLTLTGSIVAVGVVAAILVFMLRRRRKG